MGLSGGVDSAVSAALLLQEGYAVTGVFITITVAGYPCTASEDRRSAQRVAAYLDIPFIDIDLSKEYEREVFRLSVEEFRKGRTPNPDAICNREIKFGAFYDFARKNGAEFVATGHYATIANEPLPFGRSGPLGQVLPSLREVHLLTSADTEKDQSYFLWAVPQEKLQHVLFPIGNKTKPEVRALAKKFGLPNYSRPDSQGLCFLGPISIEDMLVHELHPVSGDVLNEDGEIIGTHKGAALYTFGQRHGFSLHAHDTTTPPHFVVGKDIEKNTITVSTERIPRNIRTVKLSLKETNWIGTVENGSCMARFRYRQTLIPAELSIEGGGVTVILKEPYAVPEGQSLVLYKGERCLGGGVIDTVYFST